MRRDLDEITDDGLRAALERLQDVLGVGEGCEVALAAANKPVRSALDPMTQKYEWFTDEDARRHMDAIAVRYP